MFGARTSSLALVVGMVALAACGSSGGGTKKVDAATDLATATAAVVNGADLPGYASSPHTNSDDPPSSITQDFATCVNLPTTIFDTTPGAQKVNSADFTQEQTQTEISGDVVIYPAQSDADAAWTSISKSGIESCFQQLFEEAVKVGLTESEGITFGPTAVDRFDPGIGDRSIGYAVKITAAGPSSSGIFFSDFIFVARDRAAMELDFVQSGSALDRGFETSLAQKVYDRIGDKAK